MSAFEGKTEVGQKLISRRSDLRRTCGFTAAMSALIQVSSFLHCPPGRSLQQVSHLQVPELRHAGGAMAARILAGWYEVQTAALDALQFAFHQSGFRRTTLIAFDPTPDIDHFRRFVSLVSPLRARLAQREVTRFLKARRSAKTFMVAMRTSAQRAALVIVSIVPSINMPWTTLPTTITTARDT
jgi:hypothetical protein